MIRRAAALLLVLTIGCTRHESSAARRNGPPKTVILISVDTLRADRLRPDLMPRVAQLAREGITFDRAFSHVPQTFPSHATLLTGRLPQQTGVRDNIGYVLRSDVPTLAESMKGLGYRTAGAVSSYVLRRATGIDRGFESWDDELEYRSSLDVDAERDGRHTAAALEKWIDGLGPDEPLFAFLHLYEPHAPYEAPAEYRKGRSPYDAEVAFADAIVGTFLDDLRRRNRYDDALIIFVSDHGEGLGDHGEDEHGVFVYRESIHVPLVVKLPHAERAGEHTGRIVALTDVMPTIVALAGGHPPQSDGRDLLAPAVEGRQIYVESYFPKLHLHWHELTSLIGDRYQFIDAPGRELYDHRSDPAERTNLFERERRLSFTMAGQLQPLVRFQAPAAVDPEDQRKLAALGYIGSASPDGGGEFPDPKDRIGYVRMFRQAQALARTRDDRAAVPLLRKLTKENPALFDEWGLLAQSLDRTGHRDEAIAVLREANRRFPGDPNALLQLASLLLAARNYDEARQNAEAAVHADPVLAHEVLSRIALEQGNVAQARSEIQTALAASPHRTMTLMDLARIEQRASNWSAELDALERARTETQARSLPAIRELESMRGEALLHLERGPEAETAFRAEVAAFPDDLKAWGNLAIIVAVQGRRSEARDLLAEAERRNPGPAARRMALETLEAIGK